MIDIQRKRHRRGAPRMLKHPDRNSPLHDISNTSDENRSSKRTLRRSTGLFNLDEASLGSPGTTKGSNVSVKENSLKRPFQATADPCMTGNGINATSFNYKDTFKDNFNNEPAEFPKPRNFNSSRDDNGNGVVNSPSTSIFHMKRRESMDNVFGYPNSNNSSPDRLRFADASQQFSSSAPGTLHVTSRTSPSPSPAKAMAHHQLPYHHPHNSHQHNNNTHLAMNNNISNTNSNFASLHSLTHVLENTPEGQVSNAAKNNPALLAAVGNSNDYNTPDSYKFVKPLQTAFMSTGLLSKRNRMRNHQFIDRRPPDTPCKKPSGVGVFGGSPFHNNTTASGSSSSFGSQAISYTDNNNSSPSVHSMYETHEGIKNRRSRLGLRDSLLRFSMDFGNSSTAMHDMDPPATPTKEGFSNNAFAAATINNNGIGHGARTAATTTTAIPAASPVSANINTISSPRSSTVTVNLPLATKQWSDSSSVTITGTGVSKHENNTNMTITTNNNNSPGNRWLGSSVSTTTGSQSSLSPDRISTSSSPQTPDLILHSDSMEEDSGNNLVVKVPTPLPDLPKTPAKTPKNGIAEPLAVIDKDETDSVLAGRFDHIQLVGHGEFSTVYSVSIRGDGHDDRYAIKRTKYPLSGPKARSRRLEEVSILRELTNSNTDHEGQESVLSLLDAWEANDHLYIMTIFCENGSLDTFLSERGNFSKLDEWRVWKILVEITHGLRFIHDEGFLHLDIKPANIFITFEGTLKIGDFGMATKYPAPKGIEREGDREYIAPEVLSRHEYDKPADVFSLGIMMLEIAANIVLPDNGLHWQKLRSGDLTDAGRLSSGDLCIDDLYESDNDALSPPSVPPSSRPSSIPSSVPSQPSSGVGGGYNSRHVPPWAPRFMIDDSGALDYHVKWMLDPDPTKRPTASDILTTSQVQCVDERRKAGAVIYEGDYGPEPEDEDMTRDDWRRD